MSRCVAMRYSLEAMLQNEKYVHDLKCYCDRNKEITRQIPSCPKTQAKFVPLRNNSICVFLKPLTTARFGRNFHGCRVLFMGADSNLFPVKCEAESWHQKIFLEKRFRIQMNYWTRTGSQTSPRSLATQIKAVSRPRLLPMGNRYQ